MTAGLALAELATRARRLAAAGERAILGITGPPGAGKSTLATALAGVLGPECAVVVAMDGFHIADAELVRLGRREHKGAPDTFDGHGYLALLRRLRAATEPVTYAPLFDRNIEDSIAAAVPVDRRVPLVITEGNYLLLADEPWLALRDVLDEVWYLDQPEPVRIERLIERHITHGKHPDRARAWALGSDQRNADLVATTKNRADLRIHFQV